MRRGWVLVTGALVCSLGAATSCGDSDAEVTISPASGAGGPGPESTGVGGSDGPGTGGGDARGGGSPIALPPRLDVPTSDPLASGDPGEPWSLDASRSYATQSRRPYLNGGFGTTTTRCGLEGAVVRVTNLEDAGPGSLRHAIEEVEGPRTVVFEVSGAIPLRSEIDVEEPFITVAGQTAPPPGISLYHAGLIVRTHDVCVQHLRIRVGDIRGDGSPYPPGSGDQIDALSVRNNRGLARLNGVVFDNLSLSWSSDEVFSFDRENISDVTLRDLLIAEPLNENLHEAGVHGYCALLASRAGIERVSFIANVMAHCIRRGPRVDEGTVAAVNNITYNPGVYAIQMFGRDASPDLSFTVVGNAMAYPTDESLRWPGTVDGNRGQVKALVQHFYEGPQQRRVFLQGNRSALGLPVLLDEPAFGTSPTRATVVPAAEVWHNSIYAMPAAIAEQEVLRNAGAFPAHRDVVDTRVIDDLRAGRGTFIDSQEDVGGYPVLAENRRALTPPDDPQGDDNGDGVSNLVEWLQEFTDAVE
ncbi:MAG: hypothetical protein AAGA56_06345 [Myxococcota bacterium]